MSGLSARLLLGCSIVGLAAPLSMAPLSAAAQDAPIVQPGAPGQPARVLTAEEAVRIADTRFSADDVRFMQDMIPHHRQAVEMAALVRDRTNRQELIDIAGRIDASQADEIAFMRTWLRERDQDAPDPADPHAAHGHAAMGHGTMAGMASPEQMAALAEARGTGFDRLFLELMIAHHEGAVEMVDRLLSRPGSAYDPVLFEFVGDVKNEQEAEIERMSAVLRALSDDPRSNLSAGFRDAGEAISNLTLVASLPMPPGFYDPENPAGLPPPIPPKEDDEDGAAAGDDLAPPRDADEQRAALEDSGEDVAAQDAPPARDGEDGEDEEEKARFGERSPFLDFANTDMAFSGDLLAVGNYHGFQLYRLEGAAPRLISSVICPGGQGDVSIVGGLLLMSVEQTRARVDCGLHGVAEDASPERFRGLRIFDISDPARPEQVGQVQTCRGSHTHSVVSGPDPDGVILVYNSGTSSIREEEELEGCIGPVAGDDRTALFRIDVIEIPVADPARARIVDSPTVFADPESGRIAGLWQGGDHGEGAQTTARTDHCHDITVFPSLNLAAGACSGNGVLFDISDPRRPQRIDDVLDEGFAYWHSATFNNDGTKILFTDEWGGGGRPRCRAHDPRNWGANAIYDIVGGRLEFRSYFKLPSVQTDEENCVAHNGSIVPVPGRDIFVQAWYQGGISVIDFTDSANPFEIAYFDRGPIDAEHLVVGGYWSAYWYDGRIYGTEIVRGLDVLALLPSEHLSESEIEAAALADQGAVFNPQQQFPVRWPDHPVVARAYADQLARAQALPPDTLAALGAALTRAGDRIASGESDPLLAEELETLEQGLGDDGARIAALRATLAGIAASLR